MIRLISKEFRQLLPIAGLWLSVLLLGFIIHFLTERIDEETFAGWCEGYCDYSSNTAIAIFSALLALVTAYSLLPREYDDATIDFLRALPVSNKVIFLAKVAAAWILLCVINLLSYSIDAALLTANPGSIDGRFYPQVWATLLWRDCVFAFIILSHGVLLSWFRIVGLVVYAIYLVGIMWAESSLGTSGVWSIFSLLSNEYNGSDLVVNSKALMIHSGIAVLMLLIAYRLWSRTESSVSGAPRSTRGTRIVQGLLAFLGFSGLAAVLAYRVVVGTGSNPNEVLSVVATDHFRFVYKASRQATLDYMLEHAEADFEQLGDLLGVDQLPNVRADLSAQSEHAAGLAKWKKIQMDLNAFSDDVSLRRVLSHEVAHVLQAVESDRALAANYSAVKFFIEGMAQYTSFEIVPESARRKSNWEIASVSWGRQSIEFSDLIDEGSFSKRFDPELHYSLGDLWTKAFVDTCGEAALGDFLRASGREGAIENLPAEIFWRDTTREIDCDLDTVNVNWRKQMAALYEAVDKRNYPVFSDVVIERDRASNQIKISASLSAFTTDNADSDSGSTDDFRVPSRFMIRVGAVSNQLVSSVDRVYRGRVAGEGSNKRIEFAVPASAVAQSRFRYQLGFLPTGGERYYYEIWKRGSAP
ncbi:MAG: ABC transporter permease [Granulosicoccus sp.]